MEIPLPGELRCELTVKTGRPLKRCRDKGVALSFDISVSEGYDVLRAKVKSAFATKERLTWNDGLNVYIRLAKNAPQKAFVKMDQDGFMPLLQTAWRNARLRRGGHVDFGLDIFVHIEKTKRVPTATLHRATENRVQQVLPRVQEALQAANVPFGPATLRYAATAQARLPDGEAVRVPNNTTFQQLQHIDSLEQEATTATREPDEFRTDSGYPKRSNTNVSVFVPPPEQDMDDVDHALSDDGVEQMSV
ncbi:hypothetical protein L917_08522 [Phytophthora nicotianae]|uniref:Uncharacterized protein n=3 Tax=Phytophthora nicotianae TaxID=4792 RepID=V9F5N6_PHYNI|nr:hypothetical protein F443_08857 [Phytophthora nicotianae P1569]ETL93306.1 hypothetical protein L917_08522 [Phytophthora nicotianae]ETM30598.1 hypothetical protein L914_21726 [Phytophthora nicotianae]ETO75522.1 hypothetical protein F444_08925 [Phytophthora nicotianae P1976]